MMSRATVRNWRMYAAVAVLVAAFLGAGILSLGQRGFWRTPGGGFGVQSSPEAAPQTASPALPPPTAAPEPAMDPKDVPMSSAAKAARPGQGPVPEAKAVECPRPTKSVRTAIELSSALASARPGDVIHMNDGVYTGRFTADHPGSAQERIFLCGGPGAVLDGGDIREGYVLHLDQADYWVLSGFTVRNAQKGIVADAVAGAVLEKLTVMQVGMEGIHLRRNSSSNLLLENTVRDTGQDVPEYGEGIYIGSALSNWCTMTGCRPDESNYNTISGNTISATTGESVDIKEGTVGGVVSRNRFNGTGMTTADAWVNVKGNAWTIEGNEGRDAPRDGFQTHNVLHNWGDHNLFTGNTAAVNGPGHGIAATPALHNTVSCSNTAPGARQGPSNIKCTSH
ncbi:nitrous oxide reductase family maturation protein NosD [Arthrobacter sp. ISL-72]|uniref:right-handed parallel beta-helix repeat-containing protein n=1 Tax=Arthrobacter sp. ISL-72 TaxID=2819114 RepID=UPI0020356882|nr:right-handed parallel beta-helix repeat-containing protein [Arthrobacter sp. ISL-72]